MLFLLYYNKYKIINSAETLKYLASSAIHCVDGTGRPIPHAFIADLVKPRDLASYDWVIPVFSLKIFILSDNNINSFDAIEITSLIIH